MQLSSANKVFLKQFLINGTVFSLLMALYDYYSEGQIEWWKIAVQFVLFGLVMGWFARRKFTREDQKQDENHRL